MEITLLFLSGHDSPPATQVRNPLSREHPGGVYGAVEEAAKLFGACFARPVKPDLCCLQQTRTRLNKDASLSNHIPAYASVDTAGNESPTGYEPAVSTGQYGWYGRGERV